MRRLLKYFLVLLFIGILVYLFLFELIIPSAAETSIPYKWHNVPLGHKRDVVHSYVGAPAKADKWEAQGDGWIRRVNANELSLHVWYNKDTVATCYSIRFLYLDWLVTRHYILRNDSLAVALP
ncbi:MAG: hypothetical protein K0Q66_1683 [Chitinophagaceae bacterium]|nr:hypothetical protein [Chitinophagaceae bacterium]